MNQNKSWAEATHAQRNRVGLRSPASLTRKGSRKFQTTKSTLYPHALPTQFGVLFVGEYVQVHAHEKAASCQTQWLRQLRHGRAHSKLRSQPGLPWPHRAWLGWAGLISPDLIDGLGSPESFRPRVRRPGVLRYPRARSPAERIERLQIRGTLSEDAAPGGDGRGGFCL